MKILVSRSKNNYPTKISWLFMVVTIGTPLILAQSDAPRSGHNNVLAAQEFLWLMYPDLKGNRYQMTLHLNGSFDYPVEDIAFFRLNIGQYGEGSVVSPQKPGEPSLDEPFLYAMFLFDDQGYIETAAIAGRSVGNPSAYKKVRDLVESHPEWNEAQAVAALKEAGAEFWSDEKGKLKNALGLEGMNKILGEITVDGETFQGLNRDHVGSFARLAWDVSLRASRPNGRKVHYIATFEPFKGQLEGIQALNSSSKAE
jgi:hypothetical protein